MGGRVCGCGVHAVLGLSRQRLEAIMIVNSLTCELCGVGKCWL